MLRKSSDEDERASTERSLRRAHALMTEALRILDDTPVATRCDRHLDLAIEVLGAMIGEVEAGGQVFRS